jgi:hypothetical protein
VACAKFPESNPSHCRSSPDINYSGFRRRSWARETVKGSEVNSLAKCLSVLVLMSPAVAANADIVSVVISGQITDLNAGSVPVSPDISVGDSYVWSFTYNTATQVGGNPDTILSSSLTIGSLAWGNGTQGVASVLNVGVSGGGEIDRYDFELSKPAGPNLSANSNLLYSPGTFQWTIDAPQVLTGDYPSALVPTAAQLFNAVATTNGANDTTLFNWSQEYVSGSVSSVQIDGITVRPVPLPSSAWLMICTMGGLGFMARKRR